MSALPGDSDEMQIRPTYDDKIALNYDSKSQITTLNEHDVPDGGLVAWMTVAGA